MRNLTLILVLFFMSVGAFCQDVYDTNLIPSNLKSRANACIRNEERIVDMQAPDNVIITVKKAITVFNKNGENQARLVLFYSKNSVIKSIKGELYNSLGKLTGKFSASDFFDESAADGFSLFNDERVKHYLPATSEYPYTVVYTYEIRRKQNLVIPDWFPKPSNDVSVEKSTYTFISKPEDQIRIKEQNFNNKPEEIITEKQKKLVWRANTVPATKTEPFSPNDESYLSNIKIAPQEFVYYGHKGKYTNWQELGKWVYDDLLKDRSNLSPATVQKIKDLVANEPTDKDKARKIYQYLQEKTRYVSVQIGIGGYQPFPASDVDQLGYGDCKALVNYMQSLLKAASIESYYCVVEAGTEKVSVDANYASMVQGNHIILCLPLKGDTTWLECTSQKNPFGFLGDFTDDRLVLACTAEGGKLLRTPKLTVEMNSQLRKATLSLKSDGNIEGKISTSFSGSQFDNREGIIDKPITQQLKLLKDYYDIDNIDFEAVTYLQKKNENPQLDEDISVRIRNYAPINNNKMFLQINAFNCTKPIAELRNRTLPVYINRGFTDEDTITYTLPDNIKKEAITPRISTIQTIFGSYVSKTTLEDNTLTYYRKLVLNDGTFPADSYEAFSKFMADVNSADNLKLIFSLK